MARSALDQYSMYPDFQQWAMSQGIPLNEGSLGDLFYQWMTPTVNGQQYYAAPDQMTDNSWAGTIGNTQQTLADGRTAIPMDIANQIGAQTNQGDFVQNILNSSIPVMALGGALGAYGAFGPQGFLNNSLPSFSSTPTVADAPWGVNPRDALGSDLAGYWNPADYGATGQPSLIQQGMTPAQEEYFLANGSLPPGATGGAAAPTSVSQAAAPVIESGTAASAADIARLASGAGSAGTALSRLLSGKASAGDYSSLLGTLGATGLGVLGANRQADAYQNVANQYLQMGQPYRDLLQQSYQPGFDLRSADPAYAGALTQSAQDASRAVSATSGNPFGNPGAMAEIQQNILNRTSLPYLSNYRGQLGQFGGMGLNTSSAASLQGADQSGGAFNALGYGLGQLTNPQPTLQDMLRQFQGINIGRGY